MLAFRPLVSKNAILRAYNPSKPDSESAFRRLRKADVVSEGITIKPRRGGRQRGTITAFYTLNEDAAIAYRHGDVDLARRLAAEAAKVENSAAARQLAKAVSTEPDRGVDVIVDLDSVYSLIQVKSYRKPLDKLAQRVIKDRQQFETHLTKLGARANLAWLIAVHEDGAELRGEAGAMFSMPRTPELLEFAAENAPISLRTDLMNGVLWTFIERAYSLPETTADDDPFSGLRPSLPENLEALLDAAPLRPAAITGPGLRWA